MQTYLISTHFIMILFRGNIACHKSILRLSMLSILTFICLLKNIKGIMTIQAIVRWILMIRNQQSVGLPWRSFIWIFIGKENVGSLLYVCWCAIFLLFPGEWQIDYVTGVPYFVHVTDPSKVRIKAPKDGSLFTLPELLGDYNGHIVINLPSYHLCKWRNKYCGY